MTIPPYTRPDNTGQTGTVYKANLDTAATLAERLGLAFLAQAQTSPNMTVRVLAGALLVDGALTEIAAQNTGTITAPVTNPRIDRVVIDAATGSVSVVTGTEGVSPTAPAIPSGKLPIARVALATSTTQITASLLTDERARAGGTAGLRNIGTGPEDVPSNALLTTATATITAGENLADRDAIYQDVHNQRGNGADRWYKIDAAAVGPVRISARVGVALAAINAAASGLAQVRPGRVSGFSGLTAGAAVYVSSTAGAVTQSAPQVPASGAQIALRLLGFAASATEIDFDPEADTLFVKTAEALAAGSAVVVEHWPDSGAPDRTPFAHALGAVFATSATRSNGTNGTGWGGYGARILLAASALSTSGNKVRLTFRANSGGLSFNDVYIGERAASGNAWDFAATPTRITWGGSNGATLGANSELVSDEIAFALDETKNYIVSLNFAASSDSDTVAPGSVPAGWTGYTKAAANTEAASLAPSGYSSIFGVVALKTVEVSVGTRLDPEPLFPERRFSAATDKLTCRYDDGAGGSADTKTAVINRTGAARDVVAEVAL